MSSFINGVVAAAGSAEKVYIEDVFSAYLYTGTGANRTITNGIDLAGKGGLVWTKHRTAEYHHILADTARGAVKNIASSSTSAEVTSTSNYGVTSFVNNGYTLASDANGITIDGSSQNGSINFSGFSYTSWTFRKQKKFFDIVTYTGTGSARTISHNLGSTPGMIIVKKTNTTANWQVYHRSLANTEYLVLNSTNVKATGVGRWNSTSPTATEFTVGDDTTVNANGDTYVAYLFAHDAGGFGATGTDSVVSCGSFASAAGTTVNLGWEPQFLLFKNLTTTNAADNPWFMLDTMRGFSRTVGAELRPNTTAAEGGYWNGVIIPTATGFIINATITTGPWAYLAIRRGPMKTPTIGTSVYKAITRTGTATAASVTGAGFPPDFVTKLSRNGYGHPVFTDRLRGDRLLSTSLTTAEGTSPNDSSGPIFNMDGYTTASGGTSFNYTGSTDVNHFLRRAPGFFDIVCYTGTGSATTVSHNLGVVPELMIVKGRSATSSWWVYNAALGGTKDLRLNATDAFGFNFVWNDTDPSASSFSINTNYANASGATYVAYLFATCPGVSKVGSYTGSGTTKQIDCGFTNGARFVIIKRTDSTGDWYVWDTTRGIVTGNDPYSLLNVSGQLEVTNTDYIDPYSAGFELSSTAPAALNANGGTYIFLAIA